MKKLSLVLAALFLASGSAFAAEQATTVEKCAIQEVLPGKDMTGAFVTFHHKGQR